MKLPSDNPVRVIDCLKSLGLTKYEALVYIALLKLVSATASEIHEISEVPGLRYILLLINFSIKDWYRYRSLLQSDLLHFHPKMPLPD